MPVETQTITQAYKFALKPTPRQRREFDSHVGGARVAYNWGLATTAAALDAYRAEKATGVEKPTTKIPGHFELCALWTAHKDAHQTEPDERGRTYQWVGQNFSGTYQAALRDAAAAWKNFFGSRSGKRAGRLMGRPRFKSRHRSRASFQVHGTTLRVEDAHHVRLPKVGVIKTHESTRKLLRRVKAGKARIVRGTVSQASDGGWYIALTAEIQREIRIGPSARQKAGGVIGVDFGVRYIAVTSTGQRFENPRHLEAAQKRLRRLNQTLARRVRGSNRQAKARRGLAKAHARVANLRLDALQKTTTSLIHTHSRIVVEGWDVQRTMQHGSRDVPRRLRRDRNRALADAGIGMARWQLESKARWYGCDVAVAGKNDPTGRTCSGCGQVRAKPVPLHEDEFRCFGCGWSGDRRLNTALVLAGWVGSVAPSSGETLNARGGDVRPVRLRFGGRSPVKREARAGP